jgi:hypothetical protein
MAKNGSYVKRKLKIASCANTASIANTANNCSDTILFLCLEQTQYQNNAITANKKKESQQR